MSDSGRLNDDTPLCHVCEHHYADVYYNGLPMCYGCKGKKENRSAMDDPGFEPIKRSEGTGPAMGNCPVCDAVHVAMASVAGVECCSDCYRKDWIRKHIIRGARAERMLADPALHWVNDQRPDERRHKVNDNWGPLQC